MRNIALAKRKAGIVGILIVVAYSMLTYDITKNIPLGVFADLISGLAVIGIALLMYPIFNTAKNKVLNVSYLFCKIVEGILMIIGGLLILSPSLESTRAFIYQNIHIYFFTFGALLFYLLLFKTKVVPDFISIWGLLASITLLLITIVKLMGINHVLLDVLLLPIIVNEVFLAVWLMIKGFNKQIENNAKF